MGGNTTSRQLSRFWHRRTSEALFLVATVIGGLFAWSTFAGTNALNHNLVVPLIPGVIALTSLFVIGVSYFVVPLQKLRSSLLVNYGLVLVSTTILVAQTGGVGSVFLGLFIFLLPFGAFISLRGLTISLTTFAALLIYQYLAVDPSPGQLITLSVLSGTPLAIGLILWGRNTSSADETKQDRAYNELASELSQVAGTSEVVINAIGEGVLALDGRGTVQLINPAAQQLIGWGKQDATNLSYKSILKMLDSKNQAVSETNDPVALALTTHKPQKNDNFSLETQSGKTFLASISVNPVGQLGNGVIVVFRDVTIEKSDERQRAEFISTASHEMRTPVASIEGYLGLALNPATAQIDDKARDFITKAHESAQHLGRLFADLLDVSKADDSRLKNDPKIIDVVPFIHDIVEGLTPKAKEKNLRIIYKPDPDETSVEDPVKRLNPVFYAYVDNDHLREVVQNLVENAIKYTPEGEVSVDVTGDHSHIVISIADTGIGIPHEDQSHLFQKFYRVDNSDTREIGGTGLGLYLCRRLTETIGGRIWVESEYKHGSTFFVEIPRTDHDEARRLIEQAKLKAEKESSQESSAPNHDTPSTPDSMTDNTPVQPSPVTPASSVPAPEHSAAQYQTPSPTPETQYTAPAPTSAPMPEEAIQLVNTPLSTIEANPEQYLSRRDNTPINIPPRQQ